MAAFRYPSGDDVREGDRVRYHGEGGTVDFVVVENVGDPSLDWYVEKFPGGGVMITAETFGSVFLSPTDIAEHLELITRREEA